MIGEELEPLPSKYEDHALNGHPLFWDEIKSVGLFSQLFNELGVSHVVDLSCVSGACAMAAATNHISCDGFCFNEMQQHWLGGLMDRSMLYLLTDKTSTEKAEHDAEFAASIRKCFFASIADAAKVVAGADGGAKEDKPGPRKGNPKETPKEVDSDSDSDVDSPG